MMLNVVKATAHAFIGSMSRMSLSRKARVKLSDIQPAKLMGTQIVPH